MVKIAEEQQQIGQCQPENFLLNKSKKGGVGVTMKAAPDCNVNPKYTSPNTVDEAAKVYALGMTIQLFLTQEIDGPLDFCDKNKYELSDAAWELLDNVVTKQAWKTFAELKRCSWFTQSPNKRAQEKTAAETAKGKAKLRQEYAKRSKIKFSKKYPTLTILTPSVAAAVVSKTTPPPKDRRAKGPSTSKMN